MVLRIGLGVRVGATCDSACAGAGRAVATGPIRGACSSWAGRRCAGRSRSPRRLSVPLLTQAGAPFPERDLVVFLAAATIILTLALNGFPLPWIIRKLEQAGRSGGSARGAARARRGREGCGRRRSTRRCAPSRSTEDRLFAEQLLRESLPGASRWTCARARRKPRRCARADRRGAAQLRLDRHRGRARAPAPDARGRRDQRRDAARDRGGARRARAPRRHGDRATA